MDNRYFRDAMGKFATGITVVTMKAGNEVVGMTVNAFMSVSLEPKLIAVSIGHEASMYPDLEIGKQFGLSVLQDNQKELSMIFADQKEADDEILYKWFDDVPVIKDSLATLACKIKQKTVAGDHTIFIAEVNDLQFTTGEPILYFGGEYRTVK